MSVSRRAFLIFTLPAAFGLTKTLAAEDATGPVAVIGRFYDDLLAVMKQAKRLTFDQRYNQLAAPIARTFELALMSRLAVGPRWVQLRADQQQRLTDVFSRYTISVYAERFDDYSGERFEVEPNPATNPNGVVVQSRLIKHDGDKVTLNYLMRQGSGALWQVIDVYLSGTISELATQRSEFAAVLQSSGADGLVRVLEERMAKLRTG